ncbi:peptidase C39 [Ramlibacter henchirensis]|uniref:Peptidase C39 n=1 Tax=Ramlibacter henchirensis TaxID=204072 RepID=A0A4Z0BQR9_9BURK|nr:C39 family peptidase [Ramlibacter henchirensis]TFZ00784.1 peptidase C39 [Ramlibacter henchirensis]
MLEKSAAPMGRLLIKVCALVGLFCLWPSSSAESYRAVRSIIEIRNESVVLQKWDISCGAAALATLLTYQHGYPVSEEAVARGMLRRTDPLRVKHRGGFSLLDLKRFADGLGFEADAYQEVDAASLEEMAPAIVPVVLHGYPHFVIYRGRVGETVLLADPAFGNRVMPQDQFEAVWQQNIAFVVQRPGAATPAGRRLVLQQDLLRPAASALRQLVP